jgi:prepilin-type N-terminal cleavage/methylation domain-containing protein
MAKKGFSLVEIMVVLAALAGVALLVTKLGQNSQVIQNESLVTNDYNDLVRETHYLMDNLKSCKISLQEITFSSDNLSLDNIELWTADSKGVNRNVKKISKKEKYKNLLIENVSIKIDEADDQNISDKLIKQTTATLKVAVTKGKTKIQTPDIEHSFSMNYSFDPLKKEGKIIDCDPLGARQNQVRIWCGEIVNPCGSETLEVVAIGKFSDGKFTGTFQPVSNLLDKICLAAKDHPAKFSECN